MYVGRDSWICVTQFIHVWCDSVVCVTWRVTQSCAWRDSIMYVACDIYMCVTCVLHGCDKTHVWVCDIKKSCVCHDAFICVTWHIHMCDMTRQYVWHNSLICVTWPIHLFDMPRANAWAWLVQMWEYTSNIFEIYMWDIYSDMYIRYISILGEIYRMDMSEYISHMYMWEHIYSHIHMWDLYICICESTYLGEVGGWGRVPFSRNLMSPTPRRKWYLTTGRRFH